MRWRGTWRQKLPKIPKVYELQGGPHGFFQAMPYLDKGKWNPKVKTERRNAFPEAKKIVNKYSVPKPHLTSYALTLKAPLTKEISTRAGEIQILSRTSVNKTNTCNSSSMTEKCSTSSSPAAVGASGVVGPKPAASTITKSVAANLPTRVERNLRYPKKGNQKP